MTDKENDGLQATEDEEELEISLSDDDEEESQESEAEEDETESDDDEGEDDGEESDGKPRPGYGKRAQKRIKNLIKQRSQIQRENEELRSRVEEFKAKLKESTSSSGQSQDFAISQFEERVAAQEAALEAEFDAAFEEGDKKRLFDVQRKMSSVALDRARVDEWKRRKELGEPADREDDDQGGAGQRQQQPQGEPAPRLKKWMLKNPWFRSDEEMTLDALQIDMDLREAGVEVGSEEYFAEVDEKMRELYPDKFKRTSRKVKPASAGARGGGAAKRKVTRVTLSASERAAADRLGVSYEQYAKEKAKLEAEQ